MNSIQILHAEYPSHILKGKKGGEYHGSKEKSGKEKSSAKKEGSKEKEEIAFNRKTNNPDVQTRDYLFLLQ